MTFKDTPLYGMHKCEVTEPFRQTPLKVQRVASVNARLRQEVKVCRQFS